MADIANDVVCATEGCGHLASAHADLDTGNNTGACSMQGCDCSAMTAPDAGASTTDGEALSVRMDGSRLAVYRGTERLGHLQADGTVEGSDVVFAALPPHQTPTSDKSFDPAQHAPNLPNDETALKTAHADQDTSGDPTNPASYKLLHHEVGDDGAVGPANTNAATNAISALNDGTSGVPDADKQAVHDHLAAHLTDAGKEVPPLAPADDSGDDNGGDGNAPAANSADGDTLAAGDPADGTDGTDDGVVLPEQPVDGDTNPGAPGAPPRQTFNIPVMVLEGVDTGDGRHIRGEALTWRELPIPLMAITKTTYGHDDAELVGRIETVERFDASDLVNPKTGAAYGAASDGQPTYALRGTGTFTSEDNADTVAELVGEGFLRGISVDLSDLTSIIELLDEEGSPIADDDDIGIEILFMDGDIRETVVEARVMGATVCPFPAFEGAYIELGDGTTTPAAQPSEAGVERHAINVTDTFGDRVGEPSLVASAGPMYPPAGWFTDPQFDVLTPLTITEDGRIFGHMAPWSEPHIGFPGQSIMAPRSRCNYGHFALGSVKCDDGSLASVGSITMNTVHADTVNPAIGRAEAIKHYEDTGTVVADVVVGEDRFGIWFSGSTRPDLTELDARRLRAAKLSGDWREAGGHLELVAALACNTPGFAVARVASGHPVALVAAGARQMDAVGRTRLHDLHDLVAHKDDILAAAAEGRAARARRKVHGRA